MVAQPRSTNRLNARVNWAGKKKAGIIKKFWGVCRVYCRNSQSAECKLWQGLTYEKGNVCYTPTKRQKKAKRNKAFGIYFCVNKVIH